MLAFFGWDTDAVVQQPSSSTSLLLLAPGLVAAYLLRPGEHAIARKLLRAARFFLIASTAMAFTAAATLIALYPGPAAPGVELHASDALECSLRGLAIGAGTFLVLLTISFVLPLPRSIDAGDPSAPAGET
jgi:hypothetical protein